jgi:hypothetical protein
VLWRLGRRQSRGWFREVDALRAEAGLAGEPMRIRYSTRSRAS